MSVNFGNSTTTAGSVFGTSTPASGMNLNEKKT